VEQLALVGGEAAAHGCESLLSVIMIPTWVLLTLGVAGLVVALIWASMLAATEPRTEATI
jgi:type VI protein secretion system component VasF